MFWIINDNYVYEMEGYCNYILIIMIKYLDCRNKLGF